MRHIHHSTIKSKIDPNEVYYATIEYNVDDKKLVTIKDVSLHIVENDIIKENHIQELSKETIKLAVDVLIMDKVINSKTLLYDL